MATVTLTMTGTTIGTLSTSYELTTTDASRILAYAMEIDGTEDKTPQTAMNNIGQQQLKDLIAKVVDHERKKASAAILAIEPAAIT